MKSFFKNFLGNNDENSNSEEENKIAALLYTNDSTNDRLVLEIVRNRKESNERLILLLVCIALTAEDLDVKESYLKFLKSHLRIGVFEHIQNRIKSGYRGLDNSYLTTEFSKKEALEIFYTYFKRTGESIDIFLKTDRWEHPRRAEVFEGYLQKKILNGAHDLDTKIFSKEELQTYLSHPEIDFSNCHTLILEDEVLDKLPGEILGMNFSRLFLTRCIGEGFPDIIFQFPNLNFLQINEMNFDSIPADWSALQNLETLNLYTKNYLFTNFDFLETLPMLKSFSPGSNLATHPNVLLRKKVVPLMREPRFQDYGRFYYAGYGSIFKMQWKEVLKFGVAIEKSPLSQNDKEHYFHMISTLREVTLLPDLRIVELAALLTINYSKLRAVCINRLNDLAEAGNGIDSLNENSLIWILGTPSMKKTELNAELKAQNIKSTSKFSEGITHVLIGKNPKGYVDLKGLKFELIAENRLNKFLSKNKPKFIQEAAQSGDTSMTDNVLALLENPDVANVLIGLELLKTGGIPSELMGSLLVVQKTCPDAKARKTAKKLLQLNAPEVWLPVVNDSQRFTAILTEKAQATNKKLESLAKKTSRELAAKLSMLFFKRYGRGLRYILYHFHTKSDIRSAALDALVTDKCFDYHKGLGFKKWTDPEAAHFWNMKISANVKFDVLEQHPDIEKMILHNCKMHKLPKGVGFAKDLKSLDCSFNFLKILPDSIGNCEDLEEINLQMNQFKAFPKELLKMTSLKKIDLTYQRPDGANFAVIVISEEVRKALPGCEILV